MARTPHLLAARRATDPQQREWVVGIRWLHHPPTWLGWGMRRKRKDGDGSGLWDGLDLAAADDASGLALVAGLVVLLVLSWFVLIPVLVLLLDIVLIGLLLVGAIAARVLFRRPWIVEASTAGQVVRWHVVGYRKARRSVEANADQIARGLGAGPVADATSG